MLKDRIQQLELSLLNPDVRQSRNTLNSLIADEFLEIGASGNVYNKDDILNALRIAVRPLGNNMQINETLVERLIEEQFPDWQSLPVKAVAIVVGIIVLLFRQKNASSPTL